MKKLFQIQILLKGSKPKIWRRLLIASNLPLSDFHKIIQISMGWTNSHLHQFIKNRTFYTERMPDDDTWEEMNNVDYKKLKISDLLEDENDKVIYEYDFGDSWEHEIILEKILPMDSSIKCPICLEGSMSCPPEDCGGIHAYMEMLKIIKNPKHKEYNNYLDWVGEDFDPTYFDNDEVNLLLKNRC